jgi:hypothetical protein
MWPQSTCAAPPGSHERIDVPMLYVLVAETPLASYWSDRGGAPSPGRKRRRSL